MPDVPNEEPATLRAPDAGSPRAAMAALIAVIVLLAGTFTVQQLSLEKHAAPKDPAAGQTQPALEPDPGSVSSVKGFASRIAIKLGQLLPRDSSLRKLLAQQAEVPGEGAADKLRSVIVAADLNGAEEGLTRLKALDNDKTWEGEAFFDNDLIGDAQILKRIYESGPGMVPENQLTRLEIRHGWFGRLAGVFGQSNQDTERAALVGGGVGLAFSLGLFLIATVTAFVGGVVCFVLAITKITSRRDRLRFAPPAPGGSVYLETVAVFFAGFLLLQLSAATVGPAIVGDDPHRQLIFRLAQQWLLLPVIFWPVLRGVPFATWRRQMGLTTGAGVFREIGAGIFAHLAMMPVLLATVLILYAIMRWLHIGPAVLAAGADGSGAGGGAGGTGGAAGGGPGGAIFEILGSPRPIPLMFFFLGTVWAPIVEECVFRGALLRHMRSRTGPLVAALGSAIAFGLAHGYVWYQLAPVMILGFSFALMRQWRGTLLPSMAMHCANNAVVLGLFWGLSRFAAD